MSYFQVITTLLTMCLMTFLVYYCTSSRGLVGLVATKSHACYLLGGTGWDWVQNPAGFKFQWQRRWCIWPCLVSDWLAGGFLRILFKLLLVVSKCVQKLAPAYLCELVQRKHKTKCGLRGDMLDLLHIIRSQNVTYGDWHLVCVIQQSGIEYPLTLDI